MMNNLIDYLYGTLVTPKKTMALLAARHPVGLGILTFLIINVFSSLAALLGEDFQGAMGGNLDLGPALPAIFVLTFVMTLIFWFVGLGVLHLLAEMLGGTGTIKSLIATQGFAQLPAIFVVPFAFLGIILGDWVTITASLVLGIWSLVLSVFAVKFSYGLTTGRSILTILLPGIIAIVMVIFIIIIVFAAIWPIMSQTMNQLM